MSMQLCLFTSWNMACTGLTTTCESTSLPDKVASGVHAARMSTPGAPMSGLSTPYVTLLGPRDENSATLGAAAFFTVTLFFTVTMGWLQAGRRTYRMSERQVESSKVTVGSPAGGGC